MNNQNDYNMFQKNLFTETRTVIANDLYQLTEQNLIKAITVNENLKSLGYTLKPQGLIALAKSNELETLFNTISNFEPEIKAKPMYPNFPKQVMEIDEAIFRFHQMVHYFSTYGIELLFNVQVTHGWLPNVEDTEKTVEDTTLLKAKVLDVCNLDEVYKLVANRIVAKTERFTIPEKELAKYVVLNTGGIVFDVKFKENIQVLAEDLFYTDVDKCKVLLKRICKHTGDVLDFLNYIIISKNYKQIRTTQKRMFVNLLESYNIHDFEENLVLKRMRNLTSLRYLSYNRLSKKPSHKEAIRMLRNKELRTWMSQVEQELKNCDILDMFKQRHVLSLISERPGMMLRMLRRLIRLGFNEDIIKKSLGEKADSLSLQTLVSIAKYFGQPNNEISDDGEVYISMKLYKVLTYLIAEKLKTIETEFKGKRVYLDEGMYDFDNSCIETNDKSEEGGYIRSGLAIKIPENVHRLRFFAYWNDKRRIDIDLHGRGYDLLGNLVHVGWDADFRKYGIVFSGDITHSDAAEYIDIDLDVAKKEVDYVNAEIISFTGVPFNEIDELFTGMMAVNELNENVELYNGKNVFFRHDLKAHVRSANYANIDVQNRILKLIGGNIEKSSFTLSKYLELMFNSQEVELVEDKEQADYVITLDKGLDENNISLIDENYFMDY